MPTLLSYSNSEGTRRCDSKCYDGHAEKCECICGGMNHGAGLQRALENTTEWFGEVFEVVAEVGGLNISQNQIEQLKAVNS